MKYLTTIAGREYNVEIIDDQHILLDGKVCQVDFNTIDDQPVFSLLLDGRSYEAYVYPTDEAWQVLLRGRSFPAMVLDEREARLRASAGKSLEAGGEFHLKAPMPGLVVLVAVEDGQQVESGDLLVILESMKMQNELKAPRAGRVERIRVHTGDSVEQRQTLLSVV